MDIVLHFAKLVQGEDGKPCSPTREMYKVLVIKSRDWVKVEALNVTTTSDGHDNQSANGGLATDGDIVRPKGVGYVPTFGRELYSKVT